MSIKKLYISHNYYDWRKLAKFKQLKFLENKNYNNVITSTEDADYYTTIEDVTIAKIEKICNIAENIILIDIDLNTLSKVDNLYSYGLFLQMLKNNKQLKNKTSGANFIENLIDNIESLYSQRKSPSPILWVVGCSITAGVGVENNQRFGKILADKLNMPEVLLAKTGASIFWAADQILRSEVNVGDIVVWGLTATSRVDIADNFNLRSIPITSYSNLPKENRYWNLDYFDSPTQVTMNLRYILQVINFCNKIGVKLFLINLLDPTWADIVLADKKINYINLTSTMNFESNKLQYLDLGSDNDHPGSKQHAYYAEKIFNLIKENNYGNQTV